MTDQQRENCLILAAFLRSDSRVQKEHRLKMSFWVGEEWKGKPDFSCGTSACAAGWGTTIPALRRQGLKFTPGDYSLSMDLVNKIFGGEAQHCFRGYQPDDPNIIADLLEDAARNSETTHDR